MVIDSHTHRQTDRETYRQRGTDTDETVQLQKQTDGQTTDRTDRQTSRQSGRPLACCCCCRCCCLLLLLLLLLLLRACAATYARQHKLTSICAYVRRTHFARTCFSYVRTHAVQRRSTRPSDAVPSQCSATSSRPRAAPHH